MSILDQYEILCCRLEELENLFDSGLASSTNTYEIKYLENQKRLLEQSGIGIERLRREQEIIGTFATEAAFSAMTPADQFLERFRDQDTVSALAFSVSSSVMLQSNLLDDVPESAFSVFEMANQHSYDALIGVGLSDLDKLEERHFHSSLAEFDNVAARLNKSCIGIFGGRLLSGDFSFRHYSPEEDIYISTLLELEKCGIDTALIAQNINGFASLISLGNAIGNHSYGDLIFNNDISLAFGNFVREQDSLLIQTYSDDQAMDFYNNNGFDRSLVGFDTEIFPAILKSCNVYPEIIVEEEYDEDSDSDLNQDLKLNTDAYKILYSTTKEFRVFIDSIMKNNFGSNWMKAGLTSDQKRYIKDKKDKHKKDGRKVFSDLEYLEIPKLIEIILRKNHWRIFEQYFRDKISLEAAKVRLACIRNPNSHHMKTLPEEMLILCAECSIIRKAIGRDSTLIMNAIDENKFSL